MPVEEQVGAEQEEEEEEEEGLSLWKDYVSHIPL